MTTIMQPFQWDPQPQIQYTHRITYAGTTTRCRTQKKNAFAVKTTPAATAAHTRYLSSPTATTWHEKLQGFVLRLPPQNKAHTIFMQLLQSILQHHMAGKSASLCAHGNTKWQQSYNHSNAICNRKLITLIELRIQAQPLVTERRGGTYSSQKQPQQQPPHTRGTFHRRLQILYIE